MRFVFPLSLTKSPETGREHQLPGFEMGAIGGYAPLFCGYQCRFVASMRMTTRGGTNLYHIRNICALRVRKCVRNRTLIATGKVSYRSPIEC